MLNRAQWFLAGMLIALSVQLSQTVAAAVPGGKVLQTAQTNSSNAAQKVYEEAGELYVTSKQDGKVRKIIPSPESINSQSKIQSEVSSAVGAKRTLL